MARRREPEPEPDLRQDAEWHRTCARYVARLHGWMPHDHFGHAVAELSDDELRELAEGKPGAEQVLSYLDRATTQAKGRP